MCTKYIYDCIFEAKQDLANILIISIARFFNVYLISLFNRGYCIEEDGKSGIEEITTKC